MLQAESYKEWAPGAAFDPEGEVETCFRCGRPGVRRWREDGLVCIHEEILEMMSDGLLVTPVDACALEPLPFAISHPEHI